MVRHYILKDRKPVWEPDTFVWACWMEETERRVVAQETIGAAWVSTVFLGLDHGFGGMPLFFETMLFLDGETIHCFRSSTWEEAEQDHATACELAWKAMEIGAPGAR